MDSTIKDKNSSEIDMPLKSHSLNPERSDLQDSVESASYKGSNNDILILKEKFWNYLYILTPVVLLIWPCLRIYYSKRISLCTVMAFHSLLMMIFIMQHIVPTFVCIYFYVLYCGTVLTEFNYFLTMPRESFQTAVKKTIDFFEGLFFTDMMVRAHGKQYKILLTFIALIPICILLYAASAFPARSYFDHNGNYTIYGISYYYGEYLQFQTSDSANGGYYNHPALYTGACWTILLIAIVMSIQIILFYKKIAPELKNVGNEINKFITSSEGYQNYEASVYFKNVGEEWRYRVKAFILIDYTLTLSLITLICLLGASVYIIFNDLQYSFFPGEIEYDILSTALGLYTMVGILMWIWKMFACGSIRSCALDVESKFKNIDKQLSSIMESPYSYVQVTKANKVFSAAPKDVIKWTDVTFNHNNYQRLFGDDENFIKPILSFIESQEGVPEIAFKELKVFISQKAESLRKSLRIMKADYDELYSVIEYKFFGVVPVSKLVTKITAVVGALAATLLGAYLKKQLLDLAS